MKLLLIALQAVAGPALDDPRLHAVRPRCPTPESGDVTVCGRRAGSDRLPRLPERYEGKTRPKTEVSVLGKAKMGAEVEQGGVGGVPSNRVMMRLKIPL